MCGEVATRTRDTHGNSRGWAGNSLVRKEAPRARDLGRDEQAEHGAAARVRAPRHRGHLQQPTPALKPTLARELHANASMTAAPLCVRGAAKTSRGDCTHCEKIAIYRLGEGGRTGVSCMHHSLHSLDTWTAGTSSAATAPPAMQRLATCTTFLRCRARRHQRRSVCAVSSSPPSASSCRAGDSEQRRCAAATESQCGTAAGTPGLVAGGGHQLPVL